MLPAFRAQAIPPGGSLQNSFVSGNRPGLLVLPAQAVEPEILHLTRQAYSTASARAKPVTQLTFCFLFDTVFPEKPMGPDACKTRRTLQPPNFKKKAYYR
jgi:hypothetical protein